ncbi:MAG TPA: hypothetical protein VIN08_02635 [Ohtaekwangia sp.]|uniref:DUF6915 family protein n=1 Tax=Ohtaekwangia sp. TaxID=2066019 RepID=UPI002F93B7A3
MNTWEHSVIGQRKFGGKPEDYIEIHRFLDSSKYFFYHIKHRLLLHNLYGVELAVELFGETIVNADRANVMVRDIAVEHIREDLDGKVPTLADWFAGYEDTGTFFNVVPDLGNEHLNSFVWRPYLRSGVKDSLCITISDFGIKLMEIFHGADAALKLTGILPKGSSVSDFLRKVNLTQRWQYTPQREEIEWLKQMDNNI